MSGFPLICELPAVIDASNWEWAPARSLLSSSRIDSDYWIGRDETGRRWLVKMTGGSYGHRERTFSSLAQILGISCQSSVFLLLPEEALPLVNQRLPERTQLGVLLLDEHRAPKCSGECPIGFDASSFEEIVLAEKNGIKYLSDSIRGDVLGFLCGQHEPHDHLITSDHEYVVIDNECMFSGRECLNECHWALEESTRPLVLEICEQLRSLGEDQLLKCAEMPKSVIFETRYDLRMKLLSARDGAIRYLNIFG